MVFKKIIFVILAAQLVFAQTKAKAQKKAVEKTTTEVSVEVPGAIEKNDSESAVEDRTEVSNQTDTTVEKRTNRQLRYIKPINVGISWGLVSMWLPSKLGANLSYNISERKTIALEYQSQSIKFPAFSLDIGGIKESKYGVVLKSFGDSQSFYMSYGLMKYDFRASLELSIFPTQSIPIAPLFDFRSMGFQFGLGNLFTWENGLSLGIDWFSIYFHSFNKTKNTDIFNYMDASDRDKADKTIDLIYNIPIIEILKIQLTYGF
ncbi:MAG: hypothetical protein JNM24_12710 [Bdellovibrionaceae bacterium]|nr:hypothetical protein [Pseudobdellovibrionaceae bacterium]